jgi:hypothetical protein
MIQNKHQQKGRASVALDSTFELVCAIGGNFDKS